MAVPAKRGMGLLDILPNIRLRLFNFSLKSDRHEAFGVSGTAEVQLRGEGAAKRHHSISIHPLASGCQGNLWAQGCSLCVCVCVCVCACACVCVSDRETRREHCVSVPKHVSHSNICLFPSSPIHALLAGLITTTVHSHYGFARVL